MFRIALLLVVLAAFASCTAALEPDDSAATPGAPDQASAITITSPAPDASVSGVIDVAANASASERTIASITFDLPGSVAVTDTTPPFRITWDTTNVADGSYVVHATATDDHGGTAATSARVTVGNEPCVDSSFSAAIPAPIDIPDQGGISSSLLVTGNGNVASLLLSASITRTFRHDLQVGLISPAGTVFVLDNQGILNINIRNQLIKAFNGQPAAGSWRLVVNDEVADGAVTGSDAGGAGTLEAWSLAVEGSCSPSMQ